MIDQNLKYLVYLRVRGRWAEIDHRNANTLADAVVVAAQEQPVLRVDQDSGEVGVDVSGVIKMVGSCSVWRDDCGSYEPHIEFQRDPSLWLEIAELVGSEAVFRSIANATEGEATLDMLQRLVSPAALQHVRDASEHVVSGDYPVLTKMRYLLASMRSGMVV